eukprot:TRINITY_DN6295_c0_g1_i1.p1 TRINITY_DN6295_c0_g1~~TRINITY_DN6295_c0_g1_i1.p1  ORF type:complete len:1302 (-),score=318.00 TRINITY_DN6295_c0_g1_i1:121-4026(-)
MPTEPAPLAALDRVAGHVAAAKQRREASSWAEQVAPLEFPSSLASGDERQVVDEAGFDVGDIKPPSGRPTRPPRPSERRTAMSRVRQRRVDRSPEIEEIEDSPLHTFEEDEVASGVPSRLDCPAAADWPKARASCEASHLAAAGYASGPPAVFAAPHPVARPDYSAAHSGLQAAAAAAGGLAPPPAAPAEGLRPSRPVAALGSSSVIAAMKKVKTEEERRRKRLAEVQAESQRLEPSREAAEAARLAASTPPGESLEEDGQAGSDQHSDATASADAHAEALIRKRMEIRRSAKAATLSGVAPLPAVPRPTSSETGVAAESEQARILVQDLHRSVVADELAVAAVKRTVADHVTLVPWEDVLHDAPEDDDQESVESFSADDALLLPPRSESELLTETHAQTASSASDLLHSSSSSSLKGQQKSTHTCSTRSSPDCLTSATGSYMLADFSSEASWSGDIVDGSPRLTWQRETSGDAPTADNGEAEQSCSSGSGHRPWRKQRRVASSPRAGGPVSPSGSRQLPLKVNAFFQEAVYEKAAPAAGGGQEGPRLEKKQEAADPLAKEHSDALSSSSEAESAAAVVDEGALQQDAAPCEATDSTMVMVRRMQLARRSAFGQAPTGLPRIHSLAEREPSKDAAGGECAREEDLDAEVPAASGDGQDDGSKESNTAAGAGAETPSATGVLQELSSEEADCSSSPEVAVAAAEESPAASEEAVPQCSSTASSHLEFAGFEPLVDSDSQEEEGVLELAERPSGCLLRRPDSESPSAEEEEDVTALAQEAAKAALGDSRPSASHGVRQRFSSCQGDADEAADMSPREDLHEIAMAFGFDGSPGKKMDLRVSKSVMEVLNDEMDCWIGDFDDDDLFLDEHIGERELWDQTCASRDLYDILEGSHEDDCSSYGGVSFQHSGSSSCRASPQAEEAAVEASSSVPTPPCAAPEPTAGLAQDLDDVLKTLSVLKRQAAAVRLQAAWRGYFERRKAASSVSGRSPPMEMTMTSCSEENGSTMRSTPPLEDLSRTVSPASEAPPAAASRTPSPPVSEDAGLVTAERVAEAKGSRPAGSHGRPRAKSLSDALAARRALAQGGSIGKAAVDVRPRLTERAKTAHSSSLGSATASGPPAQPPRTTGTAKRHHISELLNKAPTPQVAEELPRLAAASSQPRPTRSGGSSRSNSRGPLPTASGGAAAAKEVASAGRQSAQATNSLPPAAPGAEQSPLPASAGPAASRVDASGGGGRRRRAASSHAGGVAAGPKTAAGRRSASSGAYRSGSGGCKADGLSAQTAACYLELGKALTLGGATPRKPWG